MKKFKYIKISKTKKLRYLDNYYKKKLYIIFLPGFMSDIDGEKPQAFKKYAIKNRLGFLAIEYSYFPSLMNLGLPNPFGYSIL